MKQEIQISQDKDLMVRLETVYETLKSKGVKLILFNHLKLMHKTRGFLGYNIKTREMLAMNQKDPSNYVVANDTLFNNKRLKTLEDVIKSDNLLEHKLVYGFFDNSDYFHCSESKFSRQYKFEKSSRQTDYTKMDTLYYNPSNLDHPKYIVQEKENQFAMCNKCSALILNELEGAHLTRYGSTDTSVTYCYNCIVKDSNVSYVNANKWKLMQLYQMEKELV